MRSISAFALSLSSLTLFAGDVLASPNVPPAVPPPMTAQADVGTAPPPPTTGIVAPVAPMVAVAPASEAVAVHLDAPDEVVLEMQQNGQWVPVCASPCDRAVPLDGNYRIDGSGIRTSAPFRLQRGATRLMIEPSSSAAHAFSVVITVVGVAGALPALGVTSILVIGMFFSVILICPIADGVSKTSYGECLGDVGAFFGNWYTYPGVWIPGLAGAVMVTGGAIGLASTPRTSVTAVPMATALRRSGLPSIRPAPEWHVDTVTAVGVRQTTIPVFQMTF